MYPWLEEESSLPTSRVLIGNSQREGASKTRIFKGICESNLEFPGERSNQITSPPPHRRGRDIFVIQDRFGYHVKVGIYYHWFKICHTTVIMAVWGWVDSIIQLLAGDSATLIIVWSYAGGASVTVPVYIAETAPSSIRGRLVTTNNLFITGGQFVAAVIDGLFSSYKKNGWRY